MEKICGIYKVTSPSGKIYIGQSVDCNKRKSSYARLDCKNQHRLLNSIKKHGWENHNFEIIEQCTESELNEKEKYYVDLFQTFKKEHGLNLRDGGGSIGRWSEEVKTKMRLNHKGMEGKKHSKTTKIKMSEKRKGMKFSDEHKKRLSRANKGQNTWLGKKHSVATKKKMSLNHKGMEGKKHSKATKIKMRISKLGIIRGKYKIYPDKIKLA